MNGWIWREEKEWEWGWDWDCARGRHLALSARPIWAVELGYSHYGQWRCLKQVRYLTSAWSTNKLNSVGPLSFMFPTGCICTAQSTGPRSIPAIHAKTCLKIPATTLPSVVGAVSSCTLYGWRHATSLSRAVYEMRVACYFANTWIVRASEWLWTGALPLRNETLAETGIVMTLLIDLCSQVGAKGQPIKMVVPNLVLQLIISLRQSPLANAKQNPELASRGLRTLGKCGAIPYTSMGDLGCKRLLNLESSTRAHRIG